MGPNIQPIPTAPKLPPIAGPYVSVNQLSQFQLQQPMPSLSAGAVSLKLGGQFPSANAGQVLTVAKQLAQRTVPGAVAQAQAAAGLAVGKVRSVVRR